MIHSSDPTENIRDLLSELAEDDAEALRPLLLSRCLANVDRGQEPPSVRGSLP